MRLNFAPGRLEQYDLPIPEPEPFQVLLSVKACGICRTDLHIVDGELSGVTLPITPGHQIVGRVELLGREVSGMKIGDRVGVPWLGWTCASCRYCASGLENLCDRARFTGFHIDGGFAEYALADGRYCFRLPDLYDDVHAAPLLCAGLIGYRAFGMIGDAETIGFYGFGSAAHILLQIAAFEGRRVHAFTRAGDAGSQRLAMSLGAVSAGPSTAPAPEPLDAAIIFAPIGSLVPAALSAVRKGGIVVCAGIHMSDIPSFAYELLWGERVIRSVANLTRADGTAFFEKIGSIEIDVKATPYSWGDVNRALDDLRAGRLEGSAVLDFAI